MKKNSGNHKYFLNFCEIENYEKTKYTVDAFLEKFQV